MSTLLANLPHHLYLYVDKSFLSDGAEAGFIRASWFGLVSVPGRVWGATVLLENGAVYTPLPIHALTFSPEPVKEWTAQHSQRWDCFGVDFSTICYEQLAGRDMEVYVKPLSTWLPGTYLFTAQHYGDSYSQEPEQTKQYHFASVENGRVVALPTNCCLFHDSCFTKIDGKPTWLRVNKEVYSCETTHQWDAVITEDIG